MVRSRLRSRNRPVSIDEEITDDGYGNRGCSGYRPGLSSCRQMTGSHHELSRCGRQQPDIRPAHEIIVLMLPVWRTRASQHRHDREDDAKQINECPKVKNIEAAR